MIRATTQLYGEKWKVLVTQSCLIPWTGTHKAPLSMAFSRQEYWNEQPFHSLGDFPNSGIIEPRSPALQSGSYHLSH